jgi:thiosulfate reductase cytochrome b subunit
MFKRLVKYAAALILVLALCSVLIAPSVDLEPGTLRSLQFVAVFALMLCWLLTANIVYFHETFQLVYSRHALPPGPIPLPIAASDVSCTLLR